jgi:hypothetical protein
VDLQNRLELLVGVDLDVLLSSATAVFANLRRFPSRLAASGSFVAD